MGLANLDAQHALLDAAVGVDDELELLVRVKVRVRVGIRSGRGGGLSS